MSTATYPHTLPIPAAQMTHAQRDAARVEAGEAFVKALRDGAEYETARAVGGERLGELDGRAPVAVEVAL